MIAVLLCAGYATRMYPLTEHHPKHLLSVSGKPVLNYFMEQLLELKGLRSVHVVTNARFVSQFENWKAEWVNRIHPAPFELKVHNDGSTDNDNRLGTSADLARALKDAPEFSRMLVAAGDNIYRFKIEPLWNRFLDSRSHWIVALPESDPNRLMRTGVLEFGETDRVLRLHEKPSHPPSNWSCPAIYFLQKSAEPALREFLDVSEKTDAPGYFIDFLCRKERVRAFRVNSTRFDIGSIEDYERADALLRDHPLYLP